MDVPNPKLELVPGMYANASITLDAGARTCWSRRSRRSIARTTRRRVLVVGGDGTLEPRPVTVGLETPDRVEVRRGLQRGDLVVVGNRAQLKAGHAGDAEGHRAAGAAEGAR